MGNRKIGNLRGPESLETSKSVAGYLIPEIMESSTTEETQRVKFLCSFGGSILPRPLDGKLRYVGGETRIVSLTRDVSYEDLIGRMRELFEGTWVLKYQQPEEDLDALVSVVNDEDVVNMMEEYDKLGEGKDGVTRLRIFLFSHPDRDIGSGSLSSPRFNADERESERRYVDALNSVPNVGGMDGGSNRGGYLGNEQVNYGSVIGMDVHGMQFSNLHQLKIPRVPSYGQRFSDVDGSWSPAACYSPGHHTPRETREYSASPSSGGRFFGGMDDLGERIGDDYARHSPAHVFEQQRVGSPFVDNGNVVWFPPGGVVGEKSGFPGNLGHTHGSNYDASNICEHCHMALQRNQAVVGEMRYQDIRHEHRPPFVDQPSAGIEFCSQFSSSCAECLREREREAYLLNQEIAYGNEQTEQRNFYNDVHGNDRDWILHNQLNHRPNEMRSHRNVQYVMEGGGMNLYINGNSYTGHPMTPNYVSHNDPQYIHPASELGNEMHHDHHAVGTGSQFHGLPLEDGGIRYGSNASGFGMDGLYQVPHGSPSVHAIRRTHGPVHIAPAHDTPGVMLQSNGFPSTGSIRVAQDGSPMGHAFSHVGIDNQLQSHWMRNTGSTPQQILPSNGTSMHYIAIPKLNHGTLNGSVVHDSAVCQPAVAKYAINGESMSSYAVEGKGLASSSSATNASPNHYSNLTMAIKNEGNKLIGETDRVGRDVILAECHGSNVIPVKEKSDVIIDSNGLKFTEEKHTLTVTGDTYLPGPNEKVENHTEPLNTLPEIIASVKNVELERAEEVKKEGGVCDVNALAHEKNVSSQQLNPMSDPTKEREDISYGEQTLISKIEPTTAEEEALSKGLQTIRNGDLEEIRELGTGTYGAVYYGKWKGSDVAIKRIKASCFSGKPSERERLIADFWKEATILSSLHHPNVVSFYGVVRDGPDGSLSTVTEFMVNGSLKQFLLKKDRTIDRRKRLMLAMDAAFGMEYLHEKNIVHFDLKCENLLVNMRDPHRPVCKIGDLGLSKVKQRTLVSGGVRGTLPWMAPELLSGKTNMVSDKIDVYSFGIVMWELLTAEDPYTDMNCAAIIGGIVNNTLRPQIPSWCDPEWKSLMENCWASDPGDRPSFSEISQKLRKMAAAINLK